MLKIELINPGNTMKAIRKETDRFIDSFTNELLINAKSSTPIDKGRARSGWRKEKRGGTTSVVNRVPYIEALERGHSKQAPRGIIGPTISKTK